MAGGVTLKIRFGDFKTITRAQMLPEPSNATAELWQAASQILDNWARDAFAPVRLIGMQANHLTGGQAQLPLFPDQQSDKQRQLDRAMDTINQKLGSRTIFRGGKRT